MGINLKKCSLKQLHILNYWGINRDIDYTIYSSLTDFEGASKKVSLILNNPHKITKARPCNIQNCFFFLLVKI